MRDLLLRIALITAEKARYRYLAPVASAMVMLLLPTVFAGWYVNSSRERAIREIDSSGGYVRSYDPLRVNHAEVDGTRVSEGFYEDLGTLTGLVSLELKNAELTRENTRALKGLTGLRVLSLDNCRFEEGAMSELPRFPAMTNLVISGPGLTDDDLILLRNCPLLRQLTILRASVQGTGLKHLAGLNTVGSITIVESQIGGDAFQYMRQISEIDIRCVPIKDDDIKPLAGSKTITRLNLLSTDLTDGCLQHLADLPNLDDLSLSDSELCGTGLSQLKGLENLSILDLSRSAIDDEGLARLPALPALRELSLADTKITGKGLEHLKTLPGLRTLDLSRCQLGDGDLAALRELTLYQLNLVETQVTDEAKAELLMQWQQKQGEDFSAEIDGWIGEWPQE